MELKNGYLMISAAKGLDKEEKEEKTGKFVRRERYAGSMSRSFYVGEDIKQEDCYEVDIDLPGFKKEELSLELKNGYLLISAAKGLDKEEKEEKTGKFVRRERYAGSMSRSFYVGEDIKQEDIHAKYESGVLRLSIPKPEERKAQIEDKKYIAIEG